MQPSSLESSKLDLSYPMVFLSLSESEVAQSCPTLCDPMDCSLPGSSVHRIFQARVLEWVAISFSNAWKWKLKVKVKSLSHIWLLATPLTAAYQAPPSMGFSRQEYWSGCHYLLCLRALGYLKWLIVIASTSGTLLHLPLIKESPHS